MKVLMTRYTVEAGKRTMASRTVDPTPLFSCLEGLVQQGTTAQQGVLAESSRTEQAQALCASKRRQDCGLANNEKMMRG
jgi:hypothetical protein